MTQGDATKAQADRRGPRAPEGIEVSVGRWLGRAARWATHEMDSFAEWTHKVARGDVSRTRSRVTASRETLPQLLAQLVELVSTRSPEGVGALARDPRFWLLIGRLHARRPHGVPHRPAPASTGAPSTGASAPWPAEAGSVAHGAAGVASGAPEPAQRESMPPSTSSDSPVAAEGEVIEAALVPLGPLAIEATSHEPTSSAMEVRAPAETALATKPSSSGEALIVEESPSRALVAERTSEADARAGERGAPAPSAPPPDESASRDEKGGSTEP